MASKDGPAHTEIRQHNTIGMAMEDLPEAMENSANTESQVMENSANTESRVTQNSANMESRVTKNSANMENWVMQDLGGRGGRKSDEGKGAAPTKWPAPRLCPRGITKTQKCRLQKIRQRELAEKKEEEELDCWFNRLRP
jgi:hypothetical protein